MPRITGIGGVFLRAEHPEQLAAWYAKHFSLVLEEYGGINFEWREKDSSEKLGKTIWALFPADTEYFGPGKQRAMINYRVDDLDGLLEQLAIAGIAIDPRRESDENGQFAWIVDPEGDRVELWEPATPANKEK